MKEPLIIPLPHHPKDGRNNTALWSQIDWNQPTAAIARVMRMDPSSVAYQRKKRGLPRCRQGGARYPGKKLAYRSSAPLPVVSRQL